MTEAIQERIRQLEKEENVRVLYACESGSRDWGFASTDSDFDVRYVYCHPRNWYLSILDRPDVIERPIHNNIDLSGWDIRKALQLFRKSNPPLLEWLDSPTIYKTGGSFAQKLRSLLPHYYSPRNCLHHYRHMAEGNFKKYLGGSSVQLKRYFYVLRPVLACNWIERRTDAVPMEFAKLVHAIVPDSPLKNSIDELLDKKRQDIELGEGPRIDIIHNFLETELNRIATLQEASPAADTSTKELDNLFRDTIEEVWS